MNLIEVDCYGSSYLTEIDIQSQGVRFRFTFCEYAKRDRQFNYGLFLDRAAYTTNRWRYPKERRIAVLVESPVASYISGGACLGDQYQVVFTHLDSLTALGAPFVRLLYGLNWIGVVNGNIFQHVHCHKTANASFVGNILHGNEPGYVLRAAVADWCRASGVVDCYGRGIRPLENKLEGLASYRFSVAMENTQADMYFTEKLMDCFLSDTVPVYWGCPSIGTVFDLRGMICFSRLEELIEVIPRLDEQRYEEMRPHALENKRRSTALRLDTIDALYMRIADGILEYMSPATPLSAAQARLGRLKAFSSSAAQSVRGQLKVKQRALAAVRKLLRRNNTTNSAAP